MNLWYLVYTTWLERVKSTESSFKLALPWNNILCVRYNCMRFRFVAICYGSRENAIVLVQNARYRSNSNVRDCLMGFNLCSFNLA